MFHLEKVLGLTVESNHGLDSNPKTDLIAYVAGSTVVLSNISNSDQRHIINRSRKPIRSVAFSRCGKYLLIGEHGQNSAVKIWSVQDLEQIGEIIPDEYGSRCLTIAPDGNYLVTIGYNFTVSLWDWRKKTKICGSKVSTEIIAVSFEERGNYFVTIGKKHLKYWYIDYLDKSGLVGKSAAIRDLRDLQFCDVSCGVGRYNGSTYVVAKSGSIYIFNSKRLLERSSDVKIEINCVVVNEKCGFVGCKEGTILCFDNSTLAVLYNLPKCHVLGSGVNPSTLKDGIGDVNYPDIKALTLNEVTNSIVSIYNDHSLYIWNFQKGYDTVNKRQSFLYHSNCIWDVKMEMVREKESFMTCSSDNTIRLWNANNLNPEEIIYVDQDYAYLKVASIGERNGGEHGVRCLAICSNMMHFACGDRGGIIRIYQLAIMEECLKIEEHVGEVLTLDYSPLKSRYNLLASGGKDTQICVFDVTRNHAIIHKIKNDVSSITTVKFGVTATDRLILITSSSDGTCSIISIQSADETFLFTTIYTVSLKKVLYNIEVDKDVKYLLMACQNLKIFDLQSRDIVKILKPISKGGFVFKIALDPSNKYICASCLDKSIVIYDFNTGNYLTTLYSNLVTSLCFTRDCRRLIAVTGDGCIFVWKIIDDNKSLQEASDDENSLPIWAKKYSSKSANIVLSEKSTVPKGKWADRMEKTISIKSTYLSDESEASPSTPLSNHSGERQYFSENSNKTESPSSISKESSLESAEIRPPVPPIRKYRKSNAASLGTKKIEPPKKSIQIDERREKVSRMIGQVKQKLDDIGQRSQLKSSKSMFDLSQPPASGSWLLTYRTSVGEQKNQLGKGKSMGNLANLEFNRSDSEAEIKVKSRSSKAADNSLNPTVVRNKTKPRLSLPRVQPDREIIADKTRNKLDVPKSPKIYHNPKLSLLKANSLSRTQTDSEIILRKKWKDESNLARLNQQLSASNSELNRRESFRDVNISTVKISPQLCESVASELENTAAKAVALYRRYADSDIRSRADINGLENLALSLVWAQIKLERLIVRNK